MRARFVNLAPVLAILALPACSTIKSVPWPPWESQPDASAYHADPNPGSPWVPIGQSVRGRPILAAYSGNGPRRIYVVAGLRGDQPEPSAALAGLPAALESAAALAPADPERAALPTPRTRGARAPIVETSAPADELNSAPIHLLAATIRTVQDANPDGAAAGTAANTRGVDIDRNWPAASFVPASRSGPKPLSELETAAVYADLSSFGPELLVIVRASAAGPVVSAEGPGAITIGQTFAAAARDFDPRWRYIKDPRPFTAGSLLSLQAVDRRGTVLTVEFAAGSDPATNTRTIAAGLAAIITDRAGPLAARWVPPPESSPRSPPPRRSSAD